MADRRKAGLDRNDVVLVRFPFSDLSGSKLRPALVVGRPLGDDVILAFMTTREATAEARAEHALAPTDAEFALTGLKARSRIRLNKLATLHRALVRRRLGRIGPRTKAHVDRALRYTLEL